MTVVDRIKQTGQDNQERTAGTGELEHDKQNKTVITKLPG
jgi:hypothetical protein